MTNRVPSKIAMTIILFSLISCSSSVDPDELFDRCNHFLESNFIDESDSAETQKGLRQKMQRACERARDECRKKPQGSRCAQHAKKYK